MKNCVIKSIKRIETVDDKKFGFIFMYKITLTDIITEEDIEFTVSVPHTDNPLRALSYDVRSNIRILLTPAQIKFNSLNNP